MNLKKKLIIIITIIMMVIIIIMYMDDIKLFAKNEKELETLIHKVRT